MAELSYKPLGVDHFEFACTDAGYWSGVLQRFGFVTRDARPGEVAMALGDLRLFLMDGTLPDGGEAVRRFVAEHGEMQVRRAAIAVDSVEKAHRELSSLVGCSEVGEAE